MEGAETKTDLPLLADEGSFEAWATARQSSANLRWCRRLLSHIRAPGVGVCQTQAQAFLLIQ